MRRSRMNGRRSRKVFRRSAGSHKKNRQRARVMRGGIRL